MDDLVHDAVIDGGADRLVSRRTINLGAAWSVPVVLAAVAAPAAAGSEAVDPTPPSASLGTLDAEKGEAGSNRRVVFTLVFTDVVGENKVRITSISSGGPWDPMPTPEQTVTPEQTSAVFSLSRPDNNAALNNLVVTYTINGVAGTARITVKNYVPND